MNCTLRLALPHLFALAGFLSCIAASGHVAAAPTDKLNVLFIAVDDLRPELGCYGNTRVKSPNIDRLASRGTLFEAAYCQQAVCSPSRTSLLTGCRPDTTKVYDLQTHFRDFLPDVVTLPQHFKKHGYHTQSFGKIFHGGLDDTPSWSASSWFPKGSMYQLKANQDLVNRKRKEVAGKKVNVQRRYSLTVGPPVECADIPDNAYGDGKIADEAIRVLGEVKDKPFFLAVGFLKPHLPFIAPKKYWNLYDRQQISLADNPFPPKGAPDLAGSNWGELRAYEGVPKEGDLSEEMARELIHGYLACVSYTDAQIGRVLDELTRLGLEDNTVIVLWGDHGWKLGEHGMWCKHTNFENDTHVPMICASPRQKAAGGRSKALVEFVDIYPSLAELCSLPLPKHLEGTSFAPLMDDPGLQWKKAAFSQYPRGGQRGEPQVMGYSMRTPRYRFTQWLGATGTVIATELYDHQVDPAENVNIAERPEDAGLVADLARRLKAGWQAAKPE
ncbi:MAG: sulfatase [Planctomycetota bacterium]